MTPFGADDHTHTSSRRPLPGVAGVPSLSEAGLLRIEEEDAENDDDLPKSLPSECCDLDDDPQGLADALARLLRTCSLG